MSCRSRLLTQVWTAASIRVIDRIIMLRPMPPKKKSLKLSGNLAWLWMILFPARLRVWIAHKELSLLRIREGVLLRRLPCTIWASFLWSHQPKHKIGSILIRVRKLQSTTRSWAVMVLIFRQVIKTSWGMVFRVRAKSWAMRAIARKLIPMTMAVWKSTPTPTECNNPWKQILIRCRIQE